MTKTNCGYVVISLSCSVNILQVQDNEIMIKSQERFIVHDRKKI